MNEAEWLTTTDPTPMLEFIGSEASDRKFRLLSCAYGRILWLELPDDLWRSAVETAELFADGKVKRREMRRLSEKFVDHHYDFFQTLNEDREPDVESARAAVVACACHFDPDLADPWDEAADAALAATHAFPSEQRGLVTGSIRDLFGNPFLPVVTNPAWLTSTVVALAEGIYQKRAFDCLPVLADALQDAGCVNEDILNHCRQPGEHVRGCWVVDLLLGKK